MDLLDNETIQSSKFRTKNLFEISDDAPEMPETNVQIRFKTSVLKSRLCDNSNA